LLETTSGGSFLHVSSEKARLILDQILSSELDNLLEEKLQVAEANSLLDILSTLAILSFEQEEEKILFPNLCLISNPIFFLILETL
jgi:hypothetical protein